MSSTLHSYTESLNDLAFSDEAKARMAARLAQAAAAEKTAVSNHDADTVATPLRRTKRFPWLKAAAVVAAVVAALGAGGYGVAAAAGILPTPSEVFSDIFGDAPAQTQIIDKIGRPLEASSTSDGVTVTAKAVIGDANGCTTVFDIEWDDGHAPDLSRARIEGSDKLYLTWSKARNSLSIDGASSAVGASYFYDADPSDNSIQYVKQLDQVKLFFGDSIVGRTARLDFNELSLITPDGLEPIAKGNWGLKFRLNYEDASIALAAGQKTNLSGHDVTIRAISVSPVGISVAYDVAYQAEYTDSSNSEQSEHDQNETDKLFGLPIQVVFADGTVEDAADGGGTSTEHDGITTVTKSRTFDRVHDTASIVSVTVGDITVPMNQ